MYETDRKTVVLRILVVLVLVVLGTWAGSCVAAKRVWSQYDDLKLQAESTANRLKSAQSDFSGLQSRSTAMQKDNEALQTRAKSLQGELTQAQSKAASQQKDAEGLRSQLAEARAAAAAQQKDIETSAAQLQQVRTELSQSQSRIAALQQENTTLRNRPAGPTQADLDEMKSRNEALQQSIASLRGQLSSAQSQPALQQDIATLRAQLDAWYNWLRSSPLPPGTLPAATSGLNLVMTPTAGPAGTTISVSGTGFSPNIAGMVIMDLNGSGLVDPGEPYSYLTTTSSGTFSGILTVPSDLSPGSYTVLARFPTAAAIPSSAIFTVTLAAVTVSGMNVTLSPASGPTGTTISISGTGFTPSTAGTVFLDINGNGLVDSAEPNQNLSTTAAGTFATALIVPWLQTIPTGAYYVRARFPASTATPAMATFTVTATGVAPGRNLTLSPTAGPRGTTITVTGTGFLSDASGPVFLDINRNGLVDAGEPFQHPTTTSDGTFTTTLTLSPSAAIAAGAYPVTARFPISSDPSSATFTVQP